MQIVRDDQPMTGEDVRVRMDGTQGLKASTIRTLLQRLEVKGYVTHDVAGRTFICKAALEQPIAPKSHKQIYRLQDSLRLS